MTLAVICYSIPNGATSAILITAREEAVLFITSWPSSVLGCEEWQSFQSQKMRKKTSGKQRKDYTTWRHFELYLRVHDYKTSSSSSRIEGKKRELTRYFFPADVVKILFVSL